MLEQPDIRPTLTRKGWAYRLNQPYFYEWEKGGLRRRLKVLAGFEYDGASNPRPLWTLTGIERDGLQRAAALIHDAMYRCGGVPGDDIIQEIWNDGAEIWEEIIPPLDAEQQDESEWTRQKVDQLFCRMLREAGVPMLKRRMMYRGVRMVGWMFWKKGNVRS